MEIIRLPGYLGDREDPDRAAVPGAQADRRLGLDPISRSAARCARW
jgi:hypothetical protein